jgi:hypothetical protein
MDEVLPNRIFGKYSRNRRERLGDETKSAIV